MFNPKNFKQNRNYGGGAFRRRIRMQRQGDACDGVVRGALEDCNHGFQSTVHYAQGLITDIHPQFMRIPFTTCDGAWRPLRELCGHGVHLPPADLLEIAPPLSNCTHLHDLTLLCIAHSQRQAAIVQYDVEVTDAEAGVSQLRVWRSEEDGEKKLIHHWQATMTQMIDPPAFKDKPLFAGFSRWANASFDGLEKEAAFILQKGNLVAVGRTMDVDGMAGNRAIDENDAHSCFTYSPEHAAQAIRLGGTVRDFTRCEEQLLKFL